MALFYKRIKGCGANAEAALTYITFDTNTIAEKYKAYTNNNVTRYYISPNYFPTMGRSDGASDNPYLFGNLMTTQMIDPTQSVYGTYTLEVIGNTKDGDIAADKIIQVKKDNITILDDTEITGKVKFTSTVNFTADDSITATGIITSKTYIQAQYFNATSDIRAKENIQPLTINCLPIVKNLSIYSFDYKFDGSHSVGVIAQEAEEIQLGDFNLVNDNDSNGIDRFKTVKETKLTYILWKAVQELSEEVEQLKAELAQMKEGR